MIRRQKDFPKEILIKGILWAVKFKHDLFFIDNAGRQKPAYGLCHFDRKLIEIRMGMSPARRYEIYWHEVLHAMAHEHGFSLSHPTIYNLQGPIAQFHAENSKAA